MSDVFTKTKRSAVMAAIRSTGNKATEITLARIFREHGVKGWRRHPPVLGKPDFVFPKERVSVFVDGCFWHGCATHCRIPANNRGYWRRKIARNVARDRLVTKHLKTAGWTVLRVWEHSLRKPSRVACRVLAALAFGQSASHNSGTKPERVDARRIKQANGKDVR
jgi:DNA mismatch endonuclease (patch repair protein)